MPPLRDEYELPHLRILADLLVGKPPESVGVDRLPTDILLGPVLAMTQANGAGPLAGLRTWSEDSGLFEAVLALSDDPRAASAEVPSFPVETLPPMLRQLVEEAAQSVGTPAEMVALPLLAIASGCIGNRISLVVKSEAWTAWPALWLAVVADPGAAKTPALKAARKPLEILMREAAHEYGEDQAAHKDNVADWRRKPVKERGPEPVGPTQRRYLARDTTLEGLHKILGINPGITLLFDELTSWILGFDAYRSGKGSDRANWLSLWASEWIGIDRAGAEHISIFDPVVSIFGAVQPGRLAELIEEAGSSDGFLERFLWAVPQCKAARWSEADIDRDTIQDVHTVLRNLRHGALATVPASVRMDTTARKHWIRWYNDNADRTDNQSGIYHGVYAKLPAQLSRIALVLHCAWQHQDPSARLLSGDVLDDAIALAEYFRQHAHRALASVGTTGQTESATELLAKRMQVIAERFSDPAGWLDRHVLERLLGAVPRSDVDAARDLLLETGTLDVRVRTAGNAGERWKLHTSNSAETA